MSAHRLTEFLPSPLGESEEVASQEWLEACTWISEIISLVREQAWAGRCRRLTVVSWTEGTPSEIPIVERLLKAPRGVESNGAGRAASLSRPPPAHE